MFRQGGNALIFSSLLEKGDLWGLLRTLHSSCWHQGCCSSRTEDELKNSIELLYRSSAEADADTYASLLRRCGNQRALAEGRLVHEYVTRTGHDHDRLIGNLLVEMYGKYGSMEDARSVLDKMRRRNVFSWTIAVAAYAQNGHPRDALQLFWKMLQEGIEPDGIALVTVLDACTGFSALSQIKAIHGLVVEGGYDSEMGVGNALVNVYGKCSSLHDAKRTFDGMREKDVVSWTTMVAAYAQNGQLHEAFQLFQKMNLEGTKPNEITITSVVDACTTLEQAKLIQLCIESASYKIDLILGTALVAMYRRCKSVEDAKLVFDRMPWRDVVTWTAMVAAYAHNGHGKEALKLLEDMREAGVEPNAITLTNIIDACASIQDLDEAERVFASVGESDAVLETGIVNMYGKCGKLEQARNVFDRMLVKNVVSWNAMISAYARTGHTCEALKCFQLMDMEGTKPEAPWKMPRRFTPELSIPALDQTRL